MLQNRAEISPKSLRVLYLCLLRLHRKSHRHRYVLKAITNCVCSRLNAYAVPIANTLLNQTPSEKKLKFKTIDYVFQLPIDVWVYRLPKSHSLQTTKKLLQKITVDQQMPIRVFDSFIK